MIYLDSAATSLYKPHQVNESVIQAIRTCASPGRGGHVPSMNAAEMVYSCRESIAELFHVPSPEQVIFTFNATHGLNIAIQSLIKKGDRVVISGYEHNAVVRPLHAIGAVLDVVDAPLFAADQFMEIIQPRIVGASAVICTHVSNVFGYILPIEKIAACCLEYDVPLIVDAAQSAGVLEIDFTKLGAEYLVAPGHKGLMGPQGTGVLICKNSAKPLLYGGTGSLSALPFMPEELPDRLEAGTHNVCGIAGLRAGVSYILQRTPTAIRTREDVLLSDLIRRLTKCPSLNVIYSMDSKNQCGVVSVTHKNMDVEFLADVLGKNGIAVRAGLHCAPLAHKTAGTINTGTVRFSVSPFNTSQQIAQVANILEKI